MGGRGTTSRKLAVACEPEDAHMVCMILQWRAVERGICGNNIAAWPFLWIPGPVRPSMQHSFPTSSNSIKHYHIRKYKCTWQPWNAGYQGMTWDFVFVSADVGECNRNSVSGMRDRTARYDIKGPVSIFKGVRIVPVVVVPAVSRLNMFIPISLLSSIGTAVLRVG